MAPQLYITAYKEQFRSPGRVKREELRPTSAHRRNNPQPRPDFLFPRSLQPSYRSPRAPPHAATPVSTHRPLFPPVRHLSFHCPVTACPDNSSNTTNAEVQHMPPIIPLREQALPPADRLLKLQPTESPGHTAAQLHTDLNIQQRQNRGVQFRTRPQTTNLPAASRHFAQTHQKHRSNSSLDYSGCYSCFHVVKPYQAGHYTIHPEFVSECLY